MAQNDSKSLPAIGFLTVVDKEELGLLGGYLILNAGARPLEFHCTAPVKANRAQEILYGPTLKPFLYGEQIGQTLLKKAKVQPLLVCTDVEPAMTVREFVATPVVLVDQNASHRLDAAHATVPKPKSQRLLSFSLGDQQLAVSPTHPQDQQTAAERWTPHADDFDLAEPFDRIREAIEEAQRSAR